MKLGIKVGLGSRYIVLDGDPVPPTNGRRWEGMRQIFYSAHNARIASAVLATAIPSVCPSVTRRYCVKTTARSMVQFALLDSKMCLVL